MIKKIFKLSFVLFIVLGSTSCRRENTEDQIELTDPMFSDLDLATAKVNSHKPGESKTQIGTGFYFDIDEVNNKLYMMTNTHVVDNINKDTDYLLIEPVGFIKDTTLPKLCGKLVYIEYVHSPSAKNIDIAIIELFASVPNNIQDAVQCVKRGSTYDFNGNRDKFKLLNILDKNTDITSFSRGEQFLSAGYPNGSYLRKVFNYYANMNNAFESDHDTNNVPKYYWNYDQMVFSGTTLGGSSGSAIIDTNLNVVTVLSYGYTNQNYIGGVSYRSIWDLLDKFCNSGAETYSFKNLQHCE